MGVTEHTYTATLLAASGIALPIADATVTLDEGWAPYVQATLTTPVPDAATFDLLDPRTGSRVLITASQSPVNFRSFDLAILSRSIGHLDGTVTLSLASDESLLQNDVLLSDEPNTEALAHQDSIRAVLNNVVLERIGAELEPSSVDRSFSVATDSTNLFTNPSLEASGEGWFGYFNGASRSGEWAAVGTHSLKLATPERADSWGAVDGDSGEMRNGMVAGTTYTVSGTIRLASSQTGTIISRARRIAVFWRSGSGPYVEQHSAQARNNPGATRLSLTFTLPPSATEAFVRFYHGASAGNVWWDGLRLSEGDGSLDSEYFDGDTPDTEQYEYAWTGDPGASTSQRTSLVPRTPDMLIWEPGVSAWDYAQPIFQAVGLRLYCDENRRWRLVDDTYIAPGYSVIRVAENLVDGSETITLNSTLWGDAVLITWKWTDGTGEHTQYEWATSGEQPAHTLTLNMERPYPGPGLATYIIKRARSRGRSQEAVTVSSYTCTPAQPVVTALPLAPAQTGLITSVTWNFARDEMTVRTRDLTDTNPPAWFFIPPGETWNDSPIGESWLQEVI